MSIGGLIAGGEAAGIEATLGGEALAAVGNLFFTANGALNDVQNTATGAINSAVSAAQTASTNIASTIFGNLASGLGKAIEVVTQQVDKVLTAVNKFIKPIADLFTKIDTLFQSIAHLYQTITTLIDTIKAEASQGIEGILAIPGTIANALTSVESQTMRGIAAINAGTASTTKDILIPGMSSSIGDPLKNIHDVFATPTETDFDLTQGFDPQRLETCGVSADYSAHVQRIQQGLLKPAKMVDYLGKVLADVGWLGLYLEAAVVADAECVKQIARSSNPSELLGVGDVLEAYYRGVVSLADAEKEVEKRGFSPDRFQVLRENLKFLPALRETFLLFWRGIITQQDRDAVLAKLHLSPNDIHAFEELIPEPPNPREVIPALVRTDTAATGFLRTSLTSIPPDSVRNKYLPLGLHPDRANLDWIMHWRLPDPDWWLTGYVRGIISEDDYKNAAVAGNYPSEILDNLLPIYQETVQQWMIPDILALGLLNEADAATYLHYIGMTDRDAKVLIQFGLAKAKAPVAAAAAGLQSISAANAKSMLEDGIIEGPTYIAILEAHGYSVEAAQLMEALTKQQIDLTSNKTYITDLVDEVNAGLITETQMVSDLAGKGFTQAQILAAVLKVKKAKVANAKQPTKADFNDFLKYGLISGDDYIKGLITIGYSAQWSIDYYNLEVIQHGAPAQPATIGQSGS